MEEIKKETLEQLDDNNSKAKEIVKSVIENLVNSDDTDTDPIVLLEAAADYLQKNDGIFTSIL